MWMGRSSLKNGSSFWVPAQWFFLYNQRLFPALWGAQWLGRGDNGGLWSPLGLDLWCRRANTHAIDFALTCPRTCRASPAAWSPGPSWRSTGWCSSALRRRSCRSSPARSGPCLRGSSCVCGTLRTPCAGSAEPTCQRGGGGGHDDVSPVRYHTLL